jgi:hypothetical protein
MIIFCHIFFIRFRDLAAKSKDNLVELGFPQFTVEDFHDIVSIKYIKYLIFSCIINFEKCKHKNRKRSLLHDIVIHIGKQNIAESCVSSY